MITTDISDLMFNIGMELEFFLSKENVIYNATQLFQEKISYSWTSQSYISLPSLYGNQVMHFATDGTPVEVKKYWGTDYRNLRGWGEEIEKLMLIKEYKKIHSLRRKWRNHITRSYNFINIATRHASRL